MSIRVRASRLFNKNNLIPNWALSVLGAQLVLVFFCPPIEAFGRKLFLSDLWCVLWLLAAVAYNSSIFSPRRLNIFFPATLGLLGLAFFHGAQRPPILATLNKDHFFGLLETELFQFSREFAVCGRFMSWLAAGWVASVWMTSVPEKKWKSFLNGLHTTCLVCLLGSAIFIAFEKISPSFQTRLASIFLFDPEFFFWKDRVRGNFLSPVEASVALVFLSLLTWALNRKRVALNLMGSVVAVGAVVLTRTITPLVALWLCAFVLSASSSKVRRSRTAVLFLSISIFIGLSSVLAAPQFLLGKWHDLVFRLGPWSLYWKFLVSRVDFLLLGFGFAPYHTDNSYMFVLTRGGILLFGLVFAWTLRIIVLRWQDWAFFQRLLVVFLLLTSLTLDCLIYRHVAMALIAAGIPALLQPKKLSS